MQLDLKILFWLNNLTGHWPFFDVIVVFFADRFQYALIVLLVVLLFYSDYPIKKRSKIFLSSLTAAVIARYGLTEIIRFFYQRPRPFLNYNLHNLITDNAPSFPSGHTIFFFAFSTIVYKYNKKWGRWFFVGSFLIGVSRIIAGVHYPSDILGGMILGVIVGLIVFYLIEK